jgi:putative endonuclease
MFYVYVLWSLKDHNFYVGYTSDLKKRFEAHNSGKVISTRSRKPFEIVYYEASRKEGDALRREKYLKSSYGKRYIKNRLREDFTIT